MRFYCRSYLFLTFLALLCSLAIHSFLLISNKFTPMLYNIHKRFVPTANSSFLLVLVSVSTVISIEPLFIFMHIGVCFDAISILFCLFFCAFTVIQFGFIDPHNEMLTALCITCSFWCSSCWSLLWDRPHWCWISGDSFFEYWSWVFTCSWIFFFIG